MEEFSVLLFGLYILFIASIDSSASKQTCPFPNFPENGDYSPKLIKFQLGEHITYHCDETHILVGSDTSRCKSDGKWSHLTPFCDRKVSLRNSYVMSNSGSPQSSPQVTDSNRSSCFPLKTSEKLEVNWEKQRFVSAVRLYLGKGNTNIAISTGSNGCRVNFAKYLDSSQWVPIICNENKELTTTVLIQDKSDRGNISPICEIEVYIKEEDGCENPPRKEIPNGYFKVSRSIAKLICVDGYKNDFNRLLCERKNWTDQMLACEEVLCNPDELNFTRPTGGDWIFLDPVKKVSHGTKRQLNCNTGYKRIGHPDIIECQKSGTWTETTATCVENEKPKVTTQTIIYVSVGAGVLLIIALLGAIIFFIRRQRDKQVVVIYKSPGEGSVVSGSDGESSAAYYETIHYTATLPASSSLPMPQILPDGYSLPMDGKHTLLKKKTMPADIAFSSFKQSSIYNT